MQSIQQKYVAISNKCQPYFILPPFGFATIILMYDLYSIGSVWRAQKTKPTPYSKFTKERQRVKMTVSGSMLQTIAYGLPFATVLSYLLYQFKTQKEYKDLLLFCGINIVNNEINVEWNQFRYKLPFIMIFTHFIKRIFEANFIHIISNKGPVNGAMYIGMLYSVNNIVPLLYQQKYIDKTYYSNTTLSLKIGTILFFVGYVVCN